MYYPILSFVAIFNPASNQGRIILTVEGQFTKIDLQPLSVEAYTAMLLTLKHDTAQWRSDGLIAAGPEFPTD